MKTILPLLLLSLLLTACPTTDTPPANHKRSASTRSSSSRSSDEETEPSKVRPHRGMTKSQVRRLYGDPDNQEVTSRGETWFYFFNKGHYWIPYYFGKPRTSTFHFSENGILTDFRI